MSFEQMVVSKGPDKWLLAESLFHTDEYPDEPVNPTFTAKWDTQEVILSVNVDSITKVRNEEGMYRVKGMCRMRNSQTHEEIAEHVPIEVSFSVRTRKGFAQASF